MISSIDGTATSRPIAYATLTIGGDNVPSIYWNTYFGFAPTIFVEKGNFFVTPSGKPSRSLGRTNVWGYSTRDIIHDDFVAPHLKHLIEKFRLPRIALKSFIEANDLRFYVSCYWWNPERNRIPMIPPEHETIFRQSGGGIFIDEYPCEINMDENI
jgi:hypothetical protein